jgi:hypothetical protein
MNINKDRTYTTRDGKAVRIYATDGSLPYIIHGAIMQDDGWEDSTWIANGDWQPSGSNAHNSLIEALKPNGIPVDLPDPPEVDGYRWEARGWGWQGVDTMYDCVRLGLERWIHEGYSFRYNHSNTSCDSPDKDEHFYIEYIPNAVEMTLAEVCKELGKTIKITP